MEPWREELPEEKRAQSGARGGRYIRAFPPALHSPPLASHWLNLRRKQVANKPGKRCLPLSAQHKIEWNKGREAGL